MRYPYNDGSKDSGAAIITIQYEIFFWAGNISGILSPGL